MFESVGLFPSDSDDILSGLAVRLVSFRVPAVPVTEGFFPLYLQRPLLFT
jgi:hypothetical protein